MSHIRNADGERQALRPLILENMVSKEYSNLEDKLREMKQSKMVIGAYAYEFTKLAYDTFPSPNAETDRKLAKYFIRSLSNEHIAARLAKDDLPTLHRVLIATKHLEANVALFYQSTLAQIDAAIKDCKNELKKVTAQITLEAAAQIEALCASVIYSKATRTTEFALKCLSFSVCVQPNTSLSIYSSHPARRKRAYMSSLGY